jgi:tripartite-type tricarboxylate transporter receptor subunit TctC
LIQGAFTLREFYTAVRYAKTCTPISMIGASPYVLAVYPGLAVNTVTELITLAKARPRRLNNAAFGSNSLGYLAGALFAHQVGIELNQVSYRSSAQAVFDTVSGRVERQFSTLPPAVPLIREGKLRALATTGGKLVALLQDVPDTRRGRPTRLRRGFVDGHRGAGRYAARHCEAAQWRVD